MKKLSLKTRLVLLHTGVTTAAVCMVLALLFSLSSHEILSNVQNQLEERVSGSFDLVEYEHGRLDYDSELLELKNGIYLSIYEGDGELLYGKIPYGFPYDLKFQDGSIRTVSSSGVDYSVLDMTFPVEGYGTLMIRGIVSVSDAEQGFRYTLRLALILLPLLVVLSAVCGYFLSRRALSPVSRITETVRRIQRENDLSGRIRLGPGRDEIYTLACTFDSLLETIEESVKREKQFTSDVSHELRTPVSVIQMQCEALLGRDDLNEAAKREVEIIAGKARSMSDMISQLLLLSRADQGRARVQYEVLDFSGLAEAAAEEFGTLASERGIRLHAEIQPDLSVQADQTLILRMMGNLLQNAVTYGKDGGDVWFHVDRAGESIRLIIRDNGIGISEEALPHIWERFYQADPARGGSGGSGLGLSMVQWIVRIHHGEIQVESRLGEGTVFTVWLPIRGEGPANGRPALWDGKAAE